NTNNISGLSVNSITFQDSGYTIGGSAVTLGAGGITFDDPTSPTFDTVNLGLALTTARNFTVNQTATDALRVSGVISGTGGGIIKDGAGSLRLSGNNTFTGQVVVGQGTLTVASDNALGTTGGNTQVLSGATVAVNVGSGLTINEPLLLNGGG